MNLNVSIDSVLNDDFYGAQFTSQELRNLRRFLAENHEATGPLSFHASRELGRCRELIEIARDDRRSDAGLCRSILRHRESLKYWEYRGKVLVNRK